MPELAEVEFYRKQWAGGIGKKILKVDAHVRKRIFRETDVEGLVRLLPGTRLTASHARGKQMLFRFSGGNWIGIHLGMTGKLSSESAAFTPARHDHLVLRQRACSLVFRDARLFGRVRFHHGKSEPEWWATTSPEIVSAQFTAQFMAEFLERHARAPIKAVLLNQRGFHGVGNWMADEILWRAQIVPAVRAGKLKPAQRAELYRATRFVARAAMRIIGHDFSDPPSSWLIHQRWKTEGVCPRHRTLLRRKQIGGRTTAWCPLCQH